MWIKRTTYQVMEGEPQLGTITETELMADRDEVMEVIISHMAEYQYLPEVVSTLDNYTDEEIELYVEDYLSSKQIEFMNSLFMLDSNWSEDQIAAILETLEV